MAEPGGDAPRAPGRLERHYAPRTPLEVVPVDRLGSRLAALFHLRVAVLAPAAVLQTLRAQPAVQSPASEDAVAYARELYANLHELDQAAAERIVVSAPPSRSGVDGDPRPVAARAGGEPASLGGFASCEPCCGAGVHAGEGSRSPARSMIFVAVSPTSNQQSQSIRETSMFDSIRRTARWYAAIAASLLLISCGGSSTDTPEAPPLFSKVYVLGASVTDNGNSCNLLPQVYCPPSPPYAGPRASNGLLVSELLAARYGAAMTPSRLGGTNYAYGGARTGPITGTTQRVPNMVAQLDQYLAAVNYQSNPQYLYVIDGVTFGNDIVDALTLSATNPNAPAQVVVGGVTNIAGIITRLYASGARHILVANSTDVGKTPQARAARCRRSGWCHPDVVAVQRRAGAAGRRPPGRVARIEPVSARRRGIHGGNSRQPGGVRLHERDRTVFQRPVGDADSAARLPGTYFYWDSFHPTATTANLLYQRAVKLLPI